MGKWRAFWRRLRKEPVRLPIGPAAWCAREPLMATVTSRQEAEQLAALYGIALVSCRGRIATFYDADPLAVLEKGRRQGWPPLGLNTLAEKY